MLALVEGLLKQRHGELVVSMHGEEFRGWDPARAAIADLWDLLARTVEWKGGKAPEYPRPSSKREKRDRSPFQIFGGVT